MNETEFLSLTTDVLNRIERAIEDAGLDFEVPAEGVLEIELENGSKIVVNRHTAAREIWIAARSGGFHFRHEGDAWRDTKDRTELFARLTELVLEQGGVRLSFA